MSKKLELKLENIGLIKEANIDISGLTVIAGKNNTGKSTVGKALMAVIKARNMADTDFNKKNAKKDDIELLRRKHFTKMMRLIFGSEISQKGRIGFSVDKEEQYKANISYNECTSFEAVEKMTKEKEFLDCTFITTALIWDLIDFFDGVLRMRQNSLIYADDSGSQDGSNQFEFNYPYLLWDLYIKMNEELKYMDKGNTNYIENPFKNIMGGSFMKEQGKPYRFYPTSGESIALCNTATGIKSWGILQLLYQKKRFTPQGYFIFDEPENHLHPDWQLKFAEKIVAFVGNGIRVMINTHSPYMLQALELYAKQDKNIKYSIYHAQKNENNLSIFNDISNDLSPIYKDLLAPIDELDFLDYELNKKVNK